MNKLLLLISLLLALCASAQQRDVSPVLQNYLDSDRYPENDRISVFIQGSQEDVARFTLDHGGVVKGSSNGYVFVTLSKSSLRELTAEEFVQRVDFTYSKGRALNDSSRHINNVDTIHQGHTDFLQAYTGSGTLIGVIDGGIDYDHGDFLFPDGRTRIMKYWLQHEPFDAQYTPAQFGYGQEFDSSHINIDAVPQSGQFADHGATVTGTAAGNAGQNGRHKGMAPDADLIIVSSDFGAANWKATVADAVAYIIDVADSLGKPVIINASIGDYLGSHDALDPTALFIDSLLNAQPGRLMVCAGGNSGSVAPYHLQHQVNADTTFTWFDYNGSLALGFPGVYMELWADTADMQNVSLAVAADKVTPNYDRRGVSQFHNLTANLSTIVHDTIWNGGNALATIQFWMEQRDGQYMTQVILDSPDSTQYDFALMSTGNGKFDAWSASWLGLNNMITAIPDSSTFPPIVFYQAPDTLQTIVDSWTCSPSVVTVANYYSRNQYTAWGDTVITGTWTPGALAVTSSKGPTRTGYQKPDIGATGDLQLSACTFNTISIFQNNADSIKLDQFGMHVRNGGTSMASPIVTGIGSLLLEKCPNMTTPEFMSAVHASGQSDGFTGALPNYAFGYGKVDGVQVLNYTFFQPVINGDDYFCPGGNTILGTSVYNSYLWSTGSTSSAIAVDSAQQVTVEVTNTLGCKGVSDTVVVFEAPVPPQPSVSQQGNALSSDPAWDYQWYFNGNPLFGETGQQYIVSTSGYYQVAAFNQYGCSTLSDSLFISPVGIEEISPVVGIYPNPVTDILTVEVDQAASYVLLDAAGRRISGGRLQGKTQLNTDAISTGLYSLRVENESGLWTYRLVKL